MEMDFSDTSEIVVRDQHGEIQIEDPPTPALEEPDDALLDEKMEMQSTRTWCPYYLGEADPSRGETETS